MASPNVAKKPQAKILVAEDAADIREALVEILLDLDYDVTAASDGYKAVTMFPEFQPDLAILDMRMPMMNGDDVCAEIRETSDIPIIMFTSADDSSDVNTAILKGATDFVLKTTGIDELASRVESHLVGHSEPLQPLVTDSPAEPEEIEAEVPGEVHISPSVPFATKSFTVIIDPDEESRSVIASVLTRLNQDYAVVDSAGEGMHAIEMHDADIVITEWALPDMDAFKMLAGLHRGLSAKHLIRVIMSNRLSPETQRKSNFVGINNFLEKPLDLGKVELLMAECVKKALRELKHRVAISA